MKDSAFLQLERIKQKVQHAPFFVKFVISPGSCSPCQVQQIFSWSVTYLGHNRLCPGASKQRLSSWLDWKGLLRLVRLWLSCMEYHFQPFWHATPAFDFPTDVKGQKSQPTRDHSITTIKSLFNPLENSFFTCDPATTISSPLDLSHETSNEAQRWN